MTYSRDWDETAPVDHTKFSEQPGSVRNFKTDLAERISAFIYGFVSGETDIAFKRIDFKSQGSDPSAPAATVISLYAKTVTSAAELYLRHTTGGVIQLTSLGKILLSAITIASQATGDIIYASSATALARLGGNITTTRKFYTSTGDGALATAPALNTIATSDLPALTAALMPSGSQIGHATPTQDGTARSISVSTGISSTSPATTQGGDYSQLAITYTPKISGSKIRVRGTVQVFVPAGNGGNTCAGLWKDADGTFLRIADAGHGSDSNGSCKQINFFYEMTAPSTTPIAFKVRVSQPDATSAVLVNQISGSASFNNGMGSWMEVDEIAA